MEKVRIRKIHIAVTESLFQEIRDYELLADIDNLFADLISERIEKLRNGGFSNDR